MSSDIKAVLLRLPVDIAAAVDRARGGVPRERWIRETLEAALGEECGCGTVEAGAQSTSRKSGEPAVRDESLSSSSPAPPRAFVSVPKRHVVSDEEALAAYARAAGRPLR